ncbi:hypothetical protein H0I31_02010 [Tenacibaculum sp. AHE15PA]|uniref:hypothetical protein n=1 Tax=unclassified Tenacibaculum TaxID=2635139 RepID=UPI001C4FC719|nr:MULTISPECIES: hypothetical protein [unclassified Tenacibaculum]QXP72500.1 hypothetical protein H0I30_07265 [Tenacibaculum sp. AHE14PA]QXP76416.1 hypothetical protein H0I31_02010 [Tenacibaculum sp. AHE15PA]
MPIIYTLKEFFTISITSIPKFEYRRHVHNIFFFTLIVKRLTSMSLEKKNINKLNFTDYETKN